MKKFISLIALVGVFAACEPENLQTAFNVPDATATLNVTVISAAPDFVQENANVTAAWSTGETTTGLSSSISGNPSIPAGSVKVTASWNGASESVTVSFPQIYAGMDLVLNATVFLPYNAGGYTLVAKAGTPVKTTEVFGLQASQHGHGYSKSQEVDFEGVTYKVWMLANASEFLLEDSYTYATYKGFDVKEDLKILNNDFEAAAKEVFAATTKNAGIKKGFGSFDFVVSAWALYNVINPEITTVTPYTIEAQPLLGSGNPTIPEVAKFSLYSIDYAYGKVEKADPDHASHYHAGHGHYTHDGHYLHGDNNNAGGGIISAE